MFLCEFVTLNIGKRIENLEILILKIQSYW